MRNFIKLHHAHWKAGAKVYEEPPENGGCFFVNPRFIRLVECEGLKATTISIDGEKHTRLCVESIGEVMEKIAEAEKAESFGSEWVRDKSGYPKLVIKPSGGTP